MIAEGFIIFTEAEGGEYRARRGTYDEYLEIRRTRSIPGDPGTEAPVAIVPAFVAFTTVFSNFDFLAGRSRP